MNNSITKQDVIRIISEKKTSSFRNHFSTFLNRNKNIVGEIRPDEILLWKTNYWISGGFPIFKFEFNENDELINITSKRNEFAKYINFLIFIPILSLIILSFIDIDLSLISFLFPMSLIFIFIALYIITKQIYEYEKKQLLLEFYDILDIEYKEEKIKEFTLRKLITRLIMYPLSIILIVLLVFIIPDSPILGLSGLVFIFPYIISDIIILFRDQKSNF